MEVGFVYPRSPLLRKHIEFFGFLRTPADVEVELLLFPNVVSILSITPNTAVEINGNEITTKFDPDIKEIQSDITGRILVPLYFRYLGKCNEICVVFKPLGLEHFFTRSLSEIAPLSFQSFRPDFEDWDSFISRLFALDDRDAQLELLENYFIGKLRAPALEGFDEVVRLLTDVESNRRIAEIAAMTGFHQKKLERLCKKHLGCSAATFRRITRFRHSINLQLTESKSLDLTTTSHQSNFADQSHFGKEFRRLSSMSPKEFFSSTWKLPEYGIVWKLR